MLMVINKIVKNIKSLQNELDRIKMHIKNIDD